LNEIGLAFDRHVGDADIGEVLAHQWQRRQHDVLTRGNLPSRAEALWRRQNDERRWVVVIVDLITFTAVDRQPPPRIWPPRKLHSSDDSDT